MKKELSIEESDRILDEFGRKYVEYMYDGIIEKFERLKKEDPVFRDFFKNLDKNLLKDFYKIMNKYFRFSSAGSSLDLFDQETYYAIMYKHPETGEFYDLIYDLFIGSLVGECIVDDYGWIDRFSKKKLKDGK